MNSAAKDNSTAASSNCSGWPKPSGPDQIPQRFSSQGIVRPTARPAVQSSKAPSSESLNPEDGGQYPLPSRLPRLRTRQVSQSSDGFLKPNCSRSLLEHSAS